MPAFAGQAPSAFVALTNDMMPLAGQWSPIHSLSFSTQVWPIRPEALSDPQYIAPPGQSYVTQSVANDTEQVMTDIVLIAQRSSDWRSDTLEYQPAFPRYIDMEHGSEIYKVDMIIRLVFKSGFTIPLKMNPGSSFSAKIHLQRLDQPVF